jgi:hypothetical protein
MAPNFHWRDAVGTARWSFAVGRRLTRGNYVVAARALGADGARGPRSIRHISLR